MERKHEFKERENAPCAQGVQNLIRVRAGQLAEFACVVKLLAVDCDPNTTIRFRVDHQTARARRSRMLDETGNEIRTD